MRFISKRTFLYLLGQLFFIAGCTYLNAQPSTVKDCEGVLKANDYYSYAQQNNLQLDYLRTIDSETWAEMKRSNNLGAMALFSGGLFSVNDDYSAFDQKRTKYLESVHYNRNESQAINILQITTSPRAFPAYEQCLEHLNQAGLIVWASKEDSKQIELHVKYQNPSGVRSMVLQGLVSGGTVAGAPAGHIWRDRTRWGINQEKVFMITRPAGVSQTTVIVAPADGSTPYTHTFTRADGTLTLNYVGTTDVVRQKDRRVSTHTPNNDSNRGGCPNEVGHQDGKWCTSRTTLSMATSAPHFLTNPRMQCGGFGCPWASTGGVGVSGDGLTATGWLDNWGRDVDAILVADEYEHLGQAQCGLDGPIPVINGQSVLFTAPKECGPIATVKWSSLLDGSQGAAHFGEKTPANSKITLVSTLDAGTATIATYQLSK